METQTVKKAFAEALKEQRTKEVEEVKKVIQATLERLEDYKKFRSELSEKVAILEADIKDFRQGRLDRVEERQRKNPKAREVSVVKIIKKQIEQQFPHPKFEPYTIEWIANKSTSMMGTITGSCGNSITTASSGALFMSNTSGTYVLPDNKIKQIN